MKTVLLVDKDPILQAALSRCLKAEGYQVLQTESAPMALEMLAAQRIDAVIADRVISGMNGLEFCRQIRATPLGQTLPFIFLSSLGEVKDRILGHLAGGDDYLVKPCHAKELIAKVKRAIDRAERIQMAIGEGMSSPPTLTIDHPTPLPLTPAEIKVFWEVVQGFTNKQIGEHLFLSPRTVQTHLSNMLAKLGLDNRSQLVRFAFEHGHRPPQT